MKRNAKKQDAFAIHTFIRGQICNVMKKPHKPVRKRQHNRKAMIVGSWRFLELERDTLIIKWK